MLLMHGRSWICSYTVTRSQSTLRLASCQPSFVDRSSWVGWRGMHWRPIGGFVLTFWQEYTAGFYTDIESESLPKGLNEAQHMAPRHPDSTLLTQSFCPFPLVSLGLCSELFSCVLFAIGSIGFGDTGDGFVRTSFEKFGRSKKNRTGCSSIASMLSGLSNSWESAEKCLEDLRRSFVKLRRWNGYGRGFDCAYATRAWTQFDTNPTGNGSRCKCQNGRTWRWKRLTFRLGFFKQQSQSFTSISVHGLILSYFSL